MALIGKITPPEVGLVYSSKNVQLKINEKMIGSGTLYITENALAWQPDEIDTGISISWKQLTAHGISNEPSKCIYLMLDTKLIWRGVYEKEPPAAIIVPVNGGAGGDVAADEGRDEGVHSDEEEDEGNASDEYEVMTECWLIPDDPNTVETIFQAMSDCQALHPDSADSMSDESDFMDAEDEVLADPALEAQGDMENLHLNDDRFEDADEDY